MTCGHAAKGMCQGCTFEWLRTEHARLEQENADLRVQLAMAKALVATRGVRDAEIAGEVLPEGLLEFRVKS